MSHLSDVALMSMVRLSRRSWWIALYHDGHQRAEWDTLVNTLLSPFGRGHTSRWEEIEKDGMVSLRLLCPNGQIGELWGSPRQFFQLKSGIWQLSKGHSICAAHLIGVVRGPDGACEMCAWEPGARQLITMQDNIYHMAYQHIGAIAHEVQGLRV